MFGLIDSIIGLAGGVVRLMGQKEARKYVDRMIAIKMELLEEKSKGDMQDDAKTEGLLNELQIISTTIEKLPDSSGSVPNP